MPSQICTYTDYLSTSSKCFTRNFWENSKGHSALLTITDASLVVADYALTYSSQTHDQVLNAADTLRELRLLHSITHIPKTFFSLQKRVISLHYDCMLLYRYSRQGKSISTIALRQVAIKGAKVAYSTLSLAGLVFFKPLKLVSRQHHFADDTLHGIIKSWDYVAIAKSCCKIGYLGGRLATIPEKFVHRSLALSLELTDAVIGTLQLHYVRIHPAVYLSCSLAKSLFSIYRLWSKTL